MPLYGYGNARANAMPRVPPAGGRVSPARPALHNEYPRCRQAWRCLVSESHIGTRSPFAIAAGEMPVAASV